MKRFLTSLVIAAALLVPGLASAQVFSQSQVIIQPYGIGVVVSTSTGVSGKLGAVATSSLNISTSDIIEGAKLFFTNARAVASTLTGYVSGAGTISSSDSILSAIQKLNGNIASIVGSYVTSFNTRTGAITLLSGDVTTALGFTPYNATNPSGYISNVTGLVTPGTNITISGAGTSGSPYVVNASGGGSGTVGSGTQGQFPFYNANGSVLTATSTLFLTQGGTVGVGTTTPTALLSLQGLLNQPLFSIASSSGQNVLSIASTSVPTFNIPYPDLNGGFIVNFNQDATATPQIPHQDSIRIIGADFTEPALYFNAWSTRPIINFYTAAGIESLPLANTAGMELGRISARGYDGTIYTGSVSSISFQAANAFTPTSQGSWIGFRTTVIGGVGGGTETNPPVTVGITPSGGLLVGGSFFSGMTPNKQFYSVEPGAGGILAYNIGLATTSPFGVLSIAGGAGSTTPLFAVSTSTSAFATSTALTIDQNGNLSLFNGVQFSGAKLSSCAGASNALTWNAGYFGCNTISGGGGSGTVGTSSSETAGYFPDWTSTNGTPALLAGTSQLFQSGVNVGVGSTTPGAKFAINGSSLGTIPVFAIATSSATATSTVFQVNSIGNLASNGELTINDMTNTTRSALAVIGTMQAGVAGLAANSTGGNFSETYVGGVAGQKIRGTSNLGVFAGTINNTAPNSGVFPGGANGGLFASENQSIGLNLLNSIALAAEIQVNNGTGSLASTTNGIAFSVVPPAVSTGSLLTNFYGFQQAGIAVSGTLTNEAGINISSFTQATNNTEILLGSATIPTGNFGIYQSDTNNDYFAGNLGIGTSTPGFPLSVSGNSLFAGTITSTSTATSSFASDINIASGHCYQVNGTCIGAGGSGTVTSVAASVPSFLSISGSPVTTSGTLAISYSGTALPVANGGTGQTSFTSGNLIYGNLTNGLSSVATTSVSCSGNVSCTSFTVIGASPITIVGSGASVAGTNGQIQYNKFGVFGADQFFKIATTTSTATLTIGQANGTFDLGSLALSYQGSVNDGVISLVTAGGASGNRTLTLPNVTSTIAVLDLAQNFTSLQTFAANIGIGTTTPYGTVSIADVASNMKTIPFVISSSTAAFATTTLFSIDNTGHLVTGSPKGSLTSCGTANILNGNDESGTIMFTGTLVSACTLTFANPTPANQNVSCTVSANTLTSTVGVTATSSTSVIFGISTGISSDTLFYRCSRNVND